MAAVLFVTEKAASGGWKAAPEEGRPEALPVFFHTREEAVRAGGSDAAGTDSVSGATPKADREDGAVRTQNVQLPPGNYRILAEVNSSFDYNGAYPETEGDVNGQPSVVYGADFQVEQSGRLLNRTLELQLRGHGDPQGREGRIIPGTEGLTTALEQVEGILITVNP